MSDKDKKDEPEQLDDDSSDDDANQTDAGDQYSNPTISASPSILRHPNAPRPDISNVPSVVIALPSSETVVATEETPEERLRRRMRFLELRREHYNYVSHSEQCNMADTEDEDHAENHPKCEENCKPK
ncbi:uncharacterized protein LOC117150920 [Drosophila mauritiana]|uniref:Uncharacterized protein LOC117150920 n=1 Tax=Drosophila mauritiana TaxID=7226 RepID=A0A6P8LIT9_DROMA|nr:uncharacterized protein LOC117150920 [Drosophila mauritiana]